MTFLELFFLCWIAVILAIGVIAILSLIVCAAVITFHEIVENLLNEN